MDPLPTLTGDYYQINLNSYLQFCNSKCTLIMKNIAVLWKADYFRMTA